MENCSRRMNPLLLLMLLLGLAACSQPAEKNAAPAKPAAAARDAAKPASTAAPAAGASAAPSQPAGKTINVYMYSEYIDPAMLEQFKQQTGITVNLSVYEATEDMMAKMQHAGGDSQYDVIVASDHAIPVLKKLGLVQPLNGAKLPNKKNVMPRFASPAYDPGSKYSAPYQWGTMGLIIDKKQMPKYNESWGLVFDEAQQPGPFLLVDSMRDTLAAALKYQGHSINTTNSTELKQAEDLIITAKKSQKSLGFEGGAGGKNKVADGTAAVAIVYNGDAIRAIDEDKDGRLAFFVPKEGTLIWMDAMLIPSKAPNPEGAHEFINFILDPKQGAALSNFNKYATPNQASLPFITPADRANKGIYPSEEQLDKMEFLQDLGDATKLYDEAWTAIKAK